jgi:hypothetical protein
MTSECPKLPYWRKSQPAVIPRFGMLAGCDQVRSCRLRGSSLPLLLGDGERCGAMVVAAAAFSADFARIMVNGG